MADSNVSQSSCKWRWGGGGGCCFDYYLPWNSQPPPAGGSKSKSGFCKSKSGLNPDFHLHYVFASSPDYTPPLIIIKHPDFHLQLLIGHLYWVFSSSNMIKAFIQPDYQLQSSLLTVLFMVFISNHHTGSSVPDCQLQRCLMNKSLHNCHWCYIWMQLDNVNWEENKKLLLYLYHYQCRWNLGSPGVCPTNPLQNSYF